MKRPSLNEPDGWSYLDGSIADFKVLSIGPDGVRVDGAPAFDFKSIYQPATLCREHAYDLARSAGFVGPVPMAVAYQRGLSFRVESVLVRFDAGQLTHIASYDYGRADFRPGETRTKPCSNCGVETLLDTQANQP